MDENMEMQQEVQAEQGVIDRPEPVWEQYRNGGPLLRAFENRELRQLEKDNEQVQQRIHELGRQVQASVQGLGSMRSAGKAPQTDSFLIGFDQD